MPRYRLISVTGDDLGPFRTSTPIWQPGDVINHGPIDKLEVVNVTPAEDVDDVNAYVIVKRVA